MHLSDMPRVTLTCKALGVDYAVAMVGFEVRGGQSVPKFDGIVVCAEHAGAVAEAYWAAERCDYLSQSRVPRCIGHQFYLFCDIAEQLRRHTWWCLP